MIEHHLTLNVTIVTRKVIMLEIAPRRAMVHATTLEATTTSSIIKGEKMIEEMTKIKGMKVIL